MFHVLRPLMEIYVQEYISDGTVFVGAYMLKFPALFGYNTAIGNIKSHTISAWLCLTYVKVCIIIFSIDVQMAFSVTRCNNSTELIKEEEEDIQ